MAFVNEVITDADIDRYQLPFPKGSGRYWTRDAERDYYLWGGLSGNPAFGDEIRGRFWLYLGGKSIRVFLSPGKGSSSFRECPYLVVWEKVLDLVPADLHGLPIDIVLAVLREALSVYGQDGRRNEWTPNWIVQFGF